MERRAEPLRPAAQTMHDIPTLTHNPLRAMPDTEKRMLKKTARSLATIFAASLLCLSASATDIPVGYVSYDQTGANLAQFDIVNLTGANSSSPGDPSFPVTTPVSFSTLSLTVDYANGKSKTFGSSYFTLDADGFSFDGGQLSTLSGAPTGLFGAIDANLTGSFSTGSFLLNDGTTVRVIPTFSAKIVDPSGLSSGDLAVINATQTPEPPAWTLLALGMAAFIAVGRRSILTGRTSRVVLGCCGALLVFAATSSAATVKLNTLTSPSSAVGGANVSATGSGFPSGSITAGNTSVGAGLGVRGYASRGRGGLRAEGAGIDREDSVHHPRGVGPLERTSYPVNGVDGSGNGFSSGGTCSTLQVAGGPSTTLTIDTTNPKDWKINNGALLIDFNPAGGNIFGIVPKGTTDNLIDLTQVSSSGPKGFYMDNSGFGAVTGVPGYANSGQLHRLVGDLSFRQHECLHLQRALGGHA